MTEASDQADTSALDADDLPEQMRIRREKRERMLAAGIEPYPVAVPRDHTLREIREKYDDAGLEPDTRTGNEVAVAGRVIFLRNTGKLCFARLREGDGTELQAMLSLAEVGQQALDDFKALVDIGDHVAIQGEVVTSRRGELSVQARAWQMAAKTMRPLPVEHKPLSDEMRSRMRYVDLIVRQEARDMVRLRADVLRSLRRSLDERGFTEIETPILQYVHGGAAARPFLTHLNAFDRGLSLRIALELYLKRAVVGGIDKVYEIGRNFRNEGIDATHNVEFSMLECYEAYGDWRTIAGLTRDLVLDAARATGRTVVPDGRGGEIDLEQEWRTVPIHQAVSEALGEHVCVETDTETLRRYADQADVELQPTWGAGEIVVELFEQLVEDDLLEPTFVIDYPESVRPLARPHRSTPGLVEAWDLVAAGVERGTGYSELADPVIQRERLIEQSMLASGGDPEAMQLDEDFVRALEFGFPPTGGMGLGVDRLLQLLTSSGLRETILFPILRPE